MLQIWSRVSMVLHHFGKPEPDPHHSAKLDPDPHHSANPDPDLHQNQNSGAVAPQNGAMKGYGRS
jgi:hypothetical protein